MKLPECKKILNTALLAIGIIFFPIMLLTAKYILSRRKKP